MNSRAFTLSLIVAGIAMFMVYSYMEGREKVYIEKYGNEVSVVMAKTDIQELELLDESKVTITKVPQNYLAPGHIKDIKEIQNTIATIPILKGEQITKPRITYPGAATGLARQVSSGKRAFTIGINEEEGVGKLIKPGDRVDLISIIDYGGGRKDMVKAKTILQDVLVLSTGLNITNSIPMVGIQGENNEVRTMKLNNYTSFSSVTLEVDSFQAQKIILLKYLGSKPSLALRNNDDKKIVRIQGTRLYDVLGEDAADAKAYFSEKEDPNKRNAR